MDKDFYKILGIERNASKEDIRKAFHKLAHKYHPDKTNGDEAKFKEVNEAYQILSDDKRRAQYDQFGSGGFNGQGGPTGGWDFSGFTGGQGGSFEFDLGDIFGDIFGGSHQTKVKRGRDISVDILITFKESIFGTERKLLINKVGICDFCNGTGAEKGAKIKNCETCKGTGQIKETVRSILGTFQTAKTCPTCHGRGKIPEKKCHVCGGEGVYKKDDEVQVKIPSGINNGEMIRMSERGEAIIDGRSGDLYVKIHVERDEMWRRSGNDLLSDIKIKMTDAILGTDYKLKTLEGDMTLSIPAGITYGEMLRVKDRGVPNGHNHRGNLLVRVTFPTPNKLSKKAKKIIEDLREEGL
ncbi:MAG: molecular chaperone DnaJ [Candidatus Paceibacterota bacterium]|jgi:molecular chaperone DnaJ